MIAHAYSYLLLEIAKIMHRTLLFIYYLVNFINHKAKMKSKIVKDRKMIGKLSSKKLDLSFCLSK